VRDILQRLKQRKLVQCGLAYIAFAFALLQGVDIVAQRFAWPDQIEKLLILALAVGFFFALVLAWYHGEKGAQKVTGTELLILALLMLIGGGLLWSFERAAPVGAPANSTTATQAAAPAASMLPIPTKSIAVLPFVNMSGDAKNDYFSDGITEEILDALAQLPSLKVAARTSAFAFKGKAEDLRKVGEALGVAKVLEGSVQASGDEVRITAQLIDTRTGYHLWSEKYDRKLTSIFAVEDEISKAIADKLQVQLAGGNAQALVAQKVIDPRAHDFYLRGLTQYRARGSALRDAVVNFQKATAIEPDYADAWAGLAEADVQLPNYDLGDVAISMARGEVAAQRALAIDPANAAAYVALGVVSLNRWQWARADAALQRAMHLAPGDAEAIHQHAYLLLVSGNPDAALKELDRAIESDPLSPVMNAGRSEVLFHLHRYDAAWTQAQASIARNPDFALAYFFAIPVAGVTGHAAELRAYARREAELGGESPDAAAQIALGVVDRAQRAHALRVLTSQPDSPVFDPYARINWYCLLGESAKAIDVLDSAMRAGRNPAFSAEAAGSPLFDSVRHDRRFEAVLEKMGLPYTPEITQTGDKS
jgi:TolB-like protein/Tfp pilus assembly protein PilF